jgi:hypothetical protein
MYSTGELTSTDLLWHEESQEWISASDFFQVAPPALPPRMPPQAGAPNDQEFFRLGQIIVTKTRFVVGHQVFALSGITSIRTANTPADTSGQVLLILAGCFCGLISLSVLINVRSSNVSVTLPVGLFAGTIGSLMIWLGIRHQKKQKPTFSVVLRTAGGEVIAYKSHDWAMIVSLTSALNEAIVARG